MANIEQLLKEATSQIESANNPAELEQIQSQYLGKKGLLTAELKALSTLSPEQRPLVGEAVNVAKRQLIAAVEKRTAEFEKVRIAQQMAAEKIDVTLPGRGAEVGSLHPVTQVRMRLESLFQSMGFVVIEGPEIEDEFHNFTALNIPPNHPARATTDTFYLDNSELLLRTQTSPVQIRAMETYGVPIRCIAPGKVYRRDSDMTHVPMFHQMEGLWVDEGITFANLKGLLINLLEAYFEQKVKLRFRASYFPFTEPSAEVDLQCILCHGAGCRLCKGSGWIEVLGCGMVHPNALAHVGIDSDRFTGFAMGIGIDRFAMFKYGISDLRNLFENDLRFLEQF